MPEYDVTLQVTVKSRIEADSAAEAIGKAHHPFAWLDAYPRDGWRYHVTMGTAASTGGKPEDLESKVMFFGAFE